MIKKTDINGKLKVSITSVGSLYRGYDFLNFEIQTQEGLVAFAPRIKRNGLLKELINDSNKKLTFKGVLLQHYFLRFFCMHKSLYGLVGVNGEDKYKLNYYMVGIYNFLDLAYAISCALKGAESVKNI